jgi:hypothetical protein
MPSHPSPSQKGRILPRHRVALMASAMAVTGALLFAAPGGHLIVIHTWSYKLAEAA